LPQITSTVLSVSCISSLYQPCYWQCTQLAQLAQHQLHWYFCISLLVQLKTTHVATLTQTLSCNVKAWLRVSRLRLNPTKTQVMWLVSGQQLPRWILMRCHYWYRESMSSMLHEISVSSLTASCRCRHRFQPRVVLAIISSGSCVRLFDACLSSLPKS